MVFEPSQLTRLLRASGPLSGPEAQARLRVSQPTFSRLRRRAGDAVLTIGRARATRYAAPRDIPGVASPIPLYEVDAGGGSRLAARLHPIYRDGFFCEALVDDLPSQVFDDLPWFLHGMRPNGFLGRLLPRRHAELQLPTDIQAWSGDDCLRYLSIHGWDTSGAWVLGERAFTLHLQATPTVGDRLQRYPEIAADVLAHGLPGSSAAGEQPKFLATRDDGVAVLVKFSPPVENEFGQRVADLLTCEHLAHGVLAEYGHRVARSTILDAGKRRFLESERFDRSATGGRVGLVSLATLDDEFVGQRRTWSDTAAGLRAAGLIDQATEDSIAWLELFGSLIGNSDMHHGNLSFTMRGAILTGLAPVYDMLPMALAPLGGQVPDQPVMPAPPPPSLAPHWASAYAAARSFWQRASEHDSLSARFRAIAAATEIGGRTRHPFRSGMLVF